MKTLMPVVLFILCVVSLIWWWTAFFKYDMSIWSKLLFCLLFVAVAYIILWWKRREKCANLSKANSALSQQAEQAVLPELEKVKGNYLKKRLVKRRLVREYMESHGGAKAELQEERDALDVFFTPLGCTLILILSPCAFFVVKLFVSFIVLPALYVPFDIQYALCSVASVLATIVLAWKRHYMLLPVALLLAVVSIYGIWHMGLDGVAVLACHMYAYEEKGFTFRNMLHAEGVMQCSIFILLLTSLGLLLYSWLKKKTLLLYLILVAIVMYCVHNVGSDVPNANGDMLQVTWAYECTTVYWAVLADVSLMLDMPMHGVELLFLVGFVPLMWIVVSVPSFVRAWKGRNGLDDNSPQQTKYKRIYYICMAWLFVNLLAVALIGGCFVGVPVAQYDNILGNGILYALHCLTGINGYFYVVAIYAALLPCGSLILYVLAKHQIKLKGEFSV